MKLNVRPYAQKQTEWTKYKSGRNKENIKHFSSNLSIFFYSQDPFFKDFSESIWRQMSVFFWDNINKKKTVTGSKVKGTKVKFRSQVEVLRLKIFLILANPGVCKLQPKGHIQPNIYSTSINLSVAAFVLQWQNWAVVTETVWHTEPKIFTMWPLIENFLSMSYLLSWREFMIFRNQITFAQVTRLQSLSAYILKLTYLCFIQERMWGEMVPTYTHILGVP